MAEMDDALAELRHRIMGQLKPADTGIATISLRFDTQVLARIDAAARQQGISRTAWLHVAASKALER